MFFPNGQKCTGWVALSERDSGYIKGKSNERLYILKYLKIVAYAEAGKKFRQKNG
jgi:hypothetical protein